MARHQLYTFGADYLYFNENFIVTEVAGVGNDDMDAEVQVLHQNPSPGLDGGSWPFGFTTEVHESVSM